MKNDKTKFTLDRQITYQIKVPGKLEKPRLYWIGKINILMDWDHEGRPVSTLICTLDQAALIGLLRQLYGLGLPLISVISITKDLE